jgi:hypothetical protein
MIQMTEVNNVLRSYIGGKGRLWDFSPSHDRLVIQLSDSTVAERRLYLILLGCTDIRLPTFWRIEAPVVSADDSGFLFIDGDRRVAFAYEFQLSKDYPQGGAPAAIIG